MKKILHLIAYLLIPLYLGIDKFGLSDYIKNHYSAKHANIVWWGLLLLSIITVIATYITSQHIPQKKYEKAQEARSLYLKDIAKKFIQKFDEKQFTRIAGVAYDKDENRAEINFNVMEVKRRWFAFLDPKKSGEGKPYLIPRTFKDVWTSEGHFIAENFILGIRQGTTGMAYRTNIIAQFSFVNTSQEKAQKEINLNKKQFEDTKSTSVLLSKTIYHKDEKDKAHKVSNLGVMTMEIKSQPLGILLAINKEELETKPTLKEAYDNTLTFLTSTLDELASEYSKLYF